MRYGKLISKLTKKTDNSGYVAVALVAGLAGGAVLSLLFAPKRGADLRKTIGDMANDLSNGAKNKYASLKNRIVRTQVELEDEVAPEIPHFVKTVPKKRKSDIADIVHEAHVQQSGD